MLTFIIFIFVISLLVFVHELGHFLTARRLGVGVEEFGFGFPPRIVGIKRGSTVYSLNWIPFGGFVRLKGELPESSRDPNSFAAQSKSRRFVILAAGVVMNYLLSIILFTIGFSIGLPAAIRSDEENPNVHGIHSEIISVDAGSPAALAGLEGGDTVTTVNEIPIVRTTELRETLQKNGGKTIALEVLRHNERVSLNVVPFQTSEGEYRIGVGIIDVGTLSYPFPQSLAEGAITTVRVTGQVFTSFGTLLKNLVIERKVSADLSGPVGVVVLTGQAFRLGIPYLIQFIALLSVTLAVVNFFPLPALDGGRALFVFIEAIRRKPIDQRIEALVHAVGFYALIALVLLVSIHDVQKYEITASIVNGFKSIVGR